MIKNDDFYYSDEESKEKDIESFLIYMEDKTKLLDEEINIIYTNLNDIISNIQIDCSSLDLPSNLIFDIRF